MNFKGKFQIGSKIIWFDGNKEHIAKSEEVLQEIKGNPVANTSHFEVYPKQSKTINSKLIVLNGITSTSNQYQYSVGNFQYKYVHELVQFSDPYVGTNTYLWLKFEYSKPLWCCWYSAG